MKRLKIFILTTIVSLNVDAQPPTDTIDDFVDLNQFIIQEMTNRNIPGATVAIIENGKLVFQENFGYADVDNKIPITNQTGFNIGSASKTLTAWGVLKLAEQNLIELDDPAKKYLTRWKIPESDFPEKDVTIRRLLSHTSGLSVFGYPGYKNKKKLPSIEKSLSKGVKIKHKPGEKFLYSGGGFTVLQLIIEEVTGDSFANYMDTAVVEPLGMINSSFKIDEDILSQSSLLYSKKGKEIPFRYFTAKAAAGFQTNMVDFLRFVQSHYSTNLVLTQTTLKEMISPIVLADQRFFYGLGEQYGLGYFLFPDITETKYIAGHSGANRGWGALFAVDSESKDAFIMLTNSMQGYFMSVTTMYQKWGKLKNKKSP